MTKLADNTASTKPGMSLGPKVLEAVRTSHMFLELPDRLLAYLSTMANSFAGAGKYGKVSRLTHALQSATMAYKAGENDELVTIALLHDIGDLLAPYNHGEFVATLLRPFITDENHWMLENHVCFQGYYYFENLGLDRNMRDQHRGHPAFPQAMKFCEQYDEPAFDLTYTAMPLIAFEPIVRRVLMDPKKSIFVKAPPTL